MNTGLDFFLDLSDSGRIALLSMFGAVGVVVAGIPAMMKGKWPIGVPTFLYGLIGIYSVGFFLAPIYTVDSGTLILSGLIFAALFMLRIIFAFPNKASHAWRLILTPFIFTVLMSLIKGEYSVVSGIYSNLVASGMIIFAGFWLSWPFFFFSIGNFSVFKKNMKEMPILGIASIAFISFFWCAGLYFSFKAGIWIIINPYGILYTIILITGILAQIFNEATFMKRMYGKTLH